MNRNFFILPGRIKLDYARDKLRPVDLRALLGDITKLEVDVIVNAANSSLRGGGGVDGAIHRAAGPNLVLESMRLAPCRTGEAKITGGHRLPAKHVVHTVGPVWQGGSKGEAELLTSCYQQSLKLAIHVQARTIAFPCISTGIYGYPSEKAAETAVAAVRDSPLQIEEVIFCCFLPQDFALYEQLLP